MSSRAPDRHIGMAAKRIEHLRRFQGRRVGLAMRDGRRIDGCRLVSHAPGGRGTLWLVADGSDTFVSVDDVVDVWDAS